MTKFMQDCKELQGAALADAMTARVRMVKKRTHEIHTGMHFRCPAANQNIKDPTLSSVAPDLPFSHPLETDNQRPS